MSRPGPRALQGTTRDAPGDTALPPGLGLPRGGEHCPRVSQLSPGSRSPVSPGTPALGRVKGAWGSRQASSPPPWADRHPWPRPGRPAQTPARRPAQTGALGARVLAPSFCKPRKVKVDAQNTLAFNEASAPTRSVSRSDYRLSVSYISPPGSPSFPGVTAWVPRAGDDPESPCPHQGRAQGSPAGGLRASQLCRMPTQGSAPPAGLSCLVTRTRARAER